jgi:nitroreductase
MQHQFARNYTFFDAPVGLVFTIDRILGQGSWLDYGMFLQNVMLAARARGLDTCPQAAFCKYHRIIARHLDIPENQMLVCGMALGYEDPDKIENSLRTERGSATSFTRFL